MGSEREMRCPGHSGSRHNGKTAALTAEPFQLHTIGAMDLIQPSMLNPEKIGEKQSKLELNSNCRGTANGELSLKGMNAVIQQRRQNWRICLVNSPWKDSLGIEPLLTTKIVFKLPPLEFWKNLVYTWYFINIFLCVSMYKKHITWHIS